MKLTLDPASNRELIDFAKEIIQGQINGMVREEFTSLIREELLRKLQATTAYNVKAQIEEIVKVYVKSAIKEVNVYSLIDKIFKEVAKDAVLQAITSRDWSEVIDQLAKEKIKALLK